MSGPAEVALRGEAQGPASVFGAPGPAALRAALTGLLAASDRVSDAVRRHDRLALEAANASADALVVEVGLLAASLTPADRPILTEFGIPAACERLAAGSRRNALLIEQAWAVDAALMRLMLGAGRAGADGSAAGYGPTPGPTWLDREA
jgi:hypothetical protein